MGVPRHCKRPAQMMPTLEHKLSASSIECVVRMMLRPGVEALRITRHMPHVSCHTLHVTRHTSHVTRLSQTLT
jgi:hypothetical protein